MVNGIICFCQPILKLREVVIIIKVVLVTGLNSLSNREYAIERINRDYSRGIISHMVRHSSPDGSNYPALISAVSNASDQLDVVYITSRDYLFNIDNDVVKGRDIFDEFLIKNNIEIIFVGDQSSVSNIRMVDEGQPYYVQKRILDMMTFV